MKSPSRPKPTTKPKPKSKRQPQLTERRHRADASGRAPYAPERGAFDGKGKQKRSPISTESQSLHRSGRGFKTKVTIPPNTTGTGEQSS
ncbi:MAG TPA: hypothetical protein VNL71_07510 [Chloroflexota bacterium]|nr:hypothetical protein [Chloroflexota bacterium]